MSTDFDRLQQAMFSPAFPCNPRPFALGLSHYVATYGSDSIKSDGAKRILWVLMAQAYGQLGTIDLHDEWGRLQPTEEPPAVTEFLEPDSPHWKPMWRALETATGDAADQCPDSGEVWQYMGTTNGVHQFRHRHRPDSAKPIAGFAGKHHDRIYLDMDAATLAVTRVNVKHYVNPPIDASTGHVIRPDSPPKPTRGTSDCDGHDYGGVFDGFQVTSDADPGL